MKISPWLRASVVLLLLGAAAAQKNTESEVLVENEPHHHLVFENEYVRVFKVEVAPHEATLVHRHKRDYVVVTIGDAEVTNAVVGKEPKKWSFKDGDVTFLEATGEKSFAHKAVNESDKPFRNFTIEVKRPSRLVHCFGECASEPMEMIGRNRDLLFRKDFIKGERSYTAAAELAIFLEPTRGKCGTHGKQFWKGDFCDLSSGAKIGPTKLFIISFLPLLPRSPKKPASTH